MDTPLFAEQSEVRVVIGPWVDRVGKVIKAEMNAGARLGWYTVLIEDKLLMFAGEELTHANPNSASHS